jgi:hypothetical protein
MVKPKKRKIKIIIIIILSRIIADLDNDITTGLNFDMECAIKRTEAMSDAHDEDNWNEDQEDVYNKAVVLEEQINGEHDPTEALADLNTALDNLD